MRTGLIRSRIIRHYLSGVVYADKAKGELPLSLRAREAYQECRDDNGARLRLLSLNRKGYVTLPRALLVVLN